MYCFLHSGVMCVARWSENFISALCRMCPTASGVGGVDVSSRFVYLFSALNLLLPSPAVQLNCFLLYCRRFALRTITHDDLYQLACRAAAQFRHTMRHSNLLQSTTVEDSRVPFWYWLSRTSHNHRSEWGPMSRHRISTFTIGKRPLGD